MTSLHRPSNICTSVPGRNLRVLFVNADFSGCALFLRSQKCVFGRIEGLLRRTLKERHTHTHTCLSVIGPLHGRDSRCVHPNKQRNLETEKQRSEINRRIANIEPCGQNKSSGYHGNREDFTASFERTQTFRSTSVQLTFFVGPDVIN
jgi:hypothetical protein